MLNQKLAFLIRFTNLVRNPTHTNDSFSVYILQRYSGRHWASGCKILLVVSSLLMKIFLFVSGQKNKKNKLDLADENKN